MVYNDFGQPVQKYYFDGSTEQIGYDVYGNAIVKIDVDGKPAYELYDKAGRKIAKLDKHTDSWTYILYNETGQVAAEIINEGLTYTSSTEPYVPVNEIKTYDGTTGIAYLYRKNPQFEITLKSTDFQVIKKSAVTYRYDKLGRLHKKTDRKMAHIHR